MRVLIVTAVFPPEPVVSAQTSVQIADALTGEGHTVEVITAFPNRPAGELYPGYTRRLFKREKVASGFRVTRCFTVLSPNSTLLSRFMENVSFGLTAGLATLITVRPDVIYVNCWAIFALGIITLAARLRGVPIIINIQDVYPESLQVQGRLRSDSSGFRLLRWWDGLVARSASHVIVLSEHFAQLYRDLRKVPPERIHIIPNWADSNLVARCIAKDMARAEIGIPNDAFVLCYGGNIGVAAGVESVIDAMKLLHDVDNLHLVIAGSGNRLAACKELVVDVSADRVHFCSPWRMDETVAPLCAADVFVLPTISNQSMISVPSKLLSYLFVGRPVISMVVSNSDTACIIEEAECGWVIPPEQPVALAQQVRTLLAEKPERLTQLGLAGREFAVKHLSQHACLPRVTNLIKDAARYDNNPDDGLR